MSAWKVINSFTIPAVVRVEASKLYILKRAAGLGKNPVNISF